MNPTDKAFKIPGSEIRRLIPDIGACFATDRITVDGMPVGYMYREQPDFEADSGWRFLAGDESQDYADNAENWAVYDVNTICNYDGAIISYLDAPVGCAFGRVAGTARFEQETFNGGEHDA